MENKELFRVRFGKKIIGVLVGEEEMTLKTEKGDVVLSSDHSSDCCEHVYADFSVMKYHAEELKGKTPYELVLLGVPKMGFILCLDNTKVLIPCYNYQNGYYSDNLSVMIKDGANSTSIDLMGFIEDHID